MISRLRALYRYFKLGRILALLFVLTAGVSGLASLVEFGDPRLPPDPAGDATLRAAFATLPTVPTDTITVHLTLDEWNDLLDGQQTNDKQPELRSVTSLQ